MYKESAIHYMGNKFKLLPQILPYFPKDIDTFYDLFGGSGVVSMNVNAKNYVLNDFNEHIYNLWNMFKTKSSDEIISYCYEMRDKFNFSINETVKTKIAENNKIPFQKFRDYVNENPSTLGYYCLTFYSFCNQFRFSKQKKFNMPVGNGYFKKQSESLIKDMCNFLSNNNVLLENKSYEEVELKSPNECFIYADIPYTNTNAVYNEISGDIGGWTEKNDYVFFKYCEELNQKGYKWAISNVFCNKRKENTHLIKWCKDNNWIVHHLNMKYASHGIDENITDEVLICNYNSDYKDNIFDMF